jgi:phosphocarrier protein
MTIAETPVLGNVILIHEAGLHARPSVKLTKLAKTFAASIDLAVTPDGPWTDAKSVAKVMAMKAPRNSQLHFRATGDDAHAAIAALIDLVNRDFEDALANG